MTIFSAALGAIGLVLAGFDLGADVVAAEQARLADCRAEIETDPELAYENALAWHGEGGRPLARYCLALSLVELGHEAEGAARLEELANAPDAGSVQDRALFLAQAGNAWLAAGLPEAAEITLTNALRLSKNDANAYKDRAAALALQDRWNEAELDLNNALALEPADFEAYRLRAEIRLQAGRLNDAMDDVDTARALDPENIDILLIRGRIRQAMWDR